MHSETYELAILLSLKDIASGKLGAFENKLRATGKAGQSFLKDYEDMKRSLGRSLVIGGIGLEGLKLLKDGAKTAGDFQSSMTDLRLSIEQAGKDGSVDLAKLNDQMARFSALGMRLGNQLPGTTQDFIDMFVSLKESGIATETILGGAGEAVAHLAVLTHSNPAELGKRYAMVGEQFGLKPEEYTPSAELFLKLYRARGMSPDDLIEGTKFAQLRGGLPMGLRGLPGMETMMTMLGVLKASGLEGGIGGRELAGLLMHLAPTSKDQKKADASLKQRGIDLQFFDNKGGYLGTENTIKQFEKLRGLSTVEQMDFVKRRFGSAEAMGPVSVFMQQGSEGYQKLKGQMDAVVPMQDQMNEKLGNYNQKMEALQGTLSNLKVTAFTPLLAPLSKAADKANDFVGALQEFSQAHGTLTTTSVYLFGIGSAALVAYGGVTALITAWRLWRMVSAVSRAGNLIDYLNGVNSSAAAAGNSVGGLAGRLTALRALGVIGVAVAVTYTVTQVAELFSSMKESGEAQKAAGAAGQGQLSSLMRMRQSYAQRGERVPEDVYRSQAASAFYQLTKKENVPLNIAGIHVADFARDDFGKAMGVDDKGAKYGRFSNILNSIGRGLTFQPSNPYMAWGGWSDRLAKNYFHEQAPELAVPEVMREFLKLSRSKLDPKAQDKLSQSLQLAYPESFKAATEQLGTSLAQLKGQTDPLGQSFTNLLMPVEKLPDGLNRANFALSGFASKVSSIIFQQPSFSMSPAPQGYAASAPAPSSAPSAGGFVFDSRQVTKVPSRAVGGDVIKSGFVNVHRGEKIVPAHVTSGLRATPVARAASNVNARAGDIRFEVNINVPAGSRAADDPAALAAHVEARVGRKIEELKAMLHPRELARLISAEVGIQMERA